MAKIFFIAATAPWHSGKNKFLAAEAKIGLFVTALSELGHQVCFIHTGPDMNESKALTFNTIQFGNYSISQLTFPRYVNGRLSRLRSLLDTNSVVSAAFSYWGKPDLIWSYNAFSVDIWLARLFAVNSATPLLLEFEDWFFARCSFYSLKPYLDWFLWRLTLKNINYCFAVNPFIADIISKHKVSTCLFPGIIRDAISQSTPLSIPASGELIRVGYSGGLLIEKGGAFLLELIQLTALRNLNLEFVVSGQGPLSNLFEEMSHKYPSICNYLGYVEDSQLPIVFKSVDIFLNPHIPMRGAFPFKLLEYISSGRPVLSAPILGLDHHDQSWLQKGVAMQDLDVETWLNFLTRLELTSQFDQLDLSELRSKIISSYGYLAVKSKTQLVIQQLLSKSYISPPISQKPNSLIFSHDI